MPDRLVSVNVRQHAAHSAVEVVPYHNTQPVGARGQVQRVTEPQAHRLQLLHLF